VGALLIASAVIGLFWPPMHLRGTEPTLTDTLHIVFAVVWNLLAVLTIVFAAAALGAPFRLYSVVTLATFVVFGILTGMEAPRIATDLPTPWIGVWERVIIEAFYLWLTVLAVVVVQALDEATVPVLAEAQRGFRSLPLDQAAELCRDRNGQADESPVFLTNLGVEENEYGCDSAICRHRNDDCRAKPHLRCQPGPAKVWLLDDVGNPERLSGLPDAARKPLATPEGDRFTGGMELLQDFFPAIAGWPALEASSVHARQPRLARGPSGGVADVLEDQSDSGLEIVHPCDLQGDPLQKRERGLGAPLLVLPFLALAGITNYPSECSRSRFALDQVIPDPGEE
jgi:hypothetical protein